MQGYRSDFCAGEGGSNTEMFYSGEVNGHFKTKRSLLISKQSGMAM